MGEVFESGGITPPEILDVGLRFPQYPNQGQWAKWRTPTGRIVVTTTSKTAPIETWYWRALAYVLEEFGGDWIID